VAHTFKDSNRYSIGRLGAPRNLRAAGVMDSANRKRDAKRDRKRTRTALRLGFEV
jgi:hypothetical protein